MYEGEDNRGVYAHWFLINIFLRRDREGGYKKDGI